MNGLKVSEDIDVIMAEMEEKTPRPKARSPTKVDFAETQKKPPEEVVSDDVDARHVNASPVGGSNDDQDAMPSSLLSMFAKKPAKPGKLFPSKPTVDKYYDFTHENVGLAIIFNQINFKGEKERFGSTKDANDLKEVLTGLGFKTEIFTDYTVSKIENLLLEGEFPDCVRV